MYGEFGSFYEMNGARACAEAKLTWELPCPEDHKETLFLALEWYSFWEVWMILSPGLRDPGPYGAGNSTLTQFQTSAVASCLIPTKLKEFSSHGSK